MAIAFDAAASGYTPSSPTLTYSQTCGALTNGILWVAIMAGDGDVITGVTYNLATMTQAVKSVVSGQGTAYLYYLVNPSNGTNDVAVTQSSTGEIESCCASYSGGSQTSVPDSSATAGPTGGGATSLAFVTNSVANNCWGICYGGLQRAMAAGTGATSRVIGPHWGTNLCDSNGPKTPAGSISMTQTFSASASIHGVVASFAPAVASANGNFLAFM